MSSHIFGIVLALLLVVAPGCVQPPAREASVPEPVASAPPVAEDVEATITQLEREWVAAIVNKDASALERLLADDFAGTSPSAHVYSKPMAISDLTSGLYVVEAMDLDELSVNVFGDTAVAFASQNEKSRYGKADASGHYHYTNVWVKRGGRWEAVASHGTRYETGHKPGA
jgi:ketosteroid isomerase-like protein